MGVGPFAYLPFILVFLKTNDAAYDTRQSVHRTMGVLTYVYILCNMLIGGNVWFADLLMFLFATFFFSQATREPGGRISVPGASTIVLFAALSIWMGSATTPPPDAETSGGSVSHQDAQLNRALETAAKVVNGIAPASDLVK